MGLVRRLVGWTLGKRLPRHEGTVAVAGSHATIDVRRDRHGIPYIDAADAHDAWFGLGFCHAQDRMGQMELIVRIARGTLAAITGKDGLGIDRLVRRLGIPHAGAAQYALADADVRAQHAAYVAGVNAGMAAARKRSHEHALLGAKPTVWEPEDPQRLTTLLCFALASNWDIELARYEIARRHGIEALHALDPLVPEELLVTSPPGAKVGAACAAFLDDAHDLGKVLGLGGGSNAWATSAAKNASGRPLLANDPHLMPQSPNPFYFSRLRCPEFTAVGASFVGTGAIAAGHNMHVAWGITAAHMDTTDLFVERIGPDGRSVEEDGVMVPCEVRREVIEVKKGEPVIEDVLVTKRGPIVGPVMEGAAENLSLAGTWLAPRPYRGFFGLHLAEDVDQLKACFDQASTTNLALVMAEEPTAAHREGRIGWLLAAEVPVRKRGSGPLPQPGWDSRFGWDGLVPSAELPVLVDPPEGFVAAANNAPVAAPDGDGAKPGKAPFLGIDFLDGYRVTGISRALAGRAEWTVAAHQALQRDVRSIAWEEVRAVVIAAAPDDARAILEPWDGRMATDSVGATVFGFFVADMVGRVVRAKADGAFAMAMGKGASVLLPHNLLFTRRTSHLTKLLRTQPDGWFADWPKEIRASLEAVIVQLRKRYGADLAKWQWGKARPLRLLHPFGEKKPMDKLFNLGPYPFGGDATTIPQASIDLRDPGANAIGVPVYRMVIDVGAWDESRFALLGGQAGNPFSANVADQVGEFLEGGGLPIYCDDAARDAVVVKHQVLIRR